jgi:outer membrane protein assembly factor BamB
LAFLTTPHDFTGDYEKALWTYPITGRGVIIGVDGESILMATGDNDINGFSTQLISINGDTGHVAWSRDMGSGSVRSNFVTTP